ncbi:hypothetical protein CONPUDRAFT_42325, partial [Coniophora puteana RWD-64-598 SS2]
LAKPPSASLPPQKVIRATSSFKPQAPTQLPFDKGDFFYVIGDPNIEGSWYEVHNPVTGGRGLVPKSMFEEFAKSPPPLATLHSDSSSSSGVRTSQLAKSPMLTGNPMSPNLPKSTVLYAVVLHDFVAERADELDAKAGESISIVAQSNREWFVAKSINKLGRPGLIPVSFVEVREPSTNRPIPFAEIEVIMDRGELPKVEDWKKAMITYKQNSIALGVIDDISTPSSVPNSPYTQHASPAFTQQSPSSFQEPSRPPSPIPLPAGILLSADVVSFHNEMDEYWFRIDAVFQPYDPSDPTILPKAKQLVLFRVYDDFYAFQVSLLESFPREAGRAPPSQRILPYMPGPADYVDDEITAARREELNDYLHKLCGLNWAGASYILEDGIIRDFLALKSGDVENDIEPRYDEIRELFSEDIEQVAQAEQGVDYDPTLEYQDEVRDALGGMKLSEDGAHSDSSVYGDDNTPAHHRGQSLASSNQHGKHGLPEDSSRSLSPIHGSQHNDYPRGSAYSRNSATSNSHWPDYSTSSPSSLHSSQPSLPASSRSRSQSTATNNLNTPPISAGNPQTAFVKIKIFDRITDDLIAIRVHPKVSHAELLGKVQARLGENVVNLRYRDSVGDEYVGIDSDKDLRGWIENTQKHVLFAD